MNSASSASRSSSGDGPRMTRMLTDFLDGKLRGEPRVPPFRQSVRIREIFGSIFLSLPEILRPRAGKEASLRALVSNPPSKIQAPFFLRKLL